MGWRTSLMWRLFHIHPFSKGWLAVLGLALLVGFGATQLGIPDTVTSWGKGGQFAFALGLGGAAGGSVLGLAWALGCLPEVTTEINKRLNRV